MGMHWVDPTSEELHGAPFTKTFIFGSWDGKLIFAEPMITKATIESKQTITTPIGVAKSYSQPGRYPTSYTIRWNETAKQYEVALTGLMARQG
jgi:hypothetical protein